MNAFIVHKSALVSMRTSHAQSRDFIVLQPPPPLRQPCIACVQLEPATYSLPVVQARGQGILQ